MEGSEQQSSTAVRPFEPIATDDAPGDVAENETRHEAEAPPPPTDAPADPPPAGQESHDESASEPKRRWRRKRKQPAQQEAAEVPLEQGHAESVPGPRGMFESDPSADAPGLDEAPPSPVPVNAPAMMTRPDAAVTDFERETAAADEPATEPEESRGPVIVPTPGRYRLPDDFAFGPGAKPHKTKRGT